MGARRDIEVDSTAVLVFDDGTRIPCDRYLLRTLCGVIRDLLESSELQVDDRGRTMVPMPGRRPEPFWDVVDILHGVTLAWNLDSSEKVLDVMDAMRYLGVTVHDPALDIKLWTLAHGDALDRLIPHVPRLVRNPALTGIVLRELVRRRPFWNEFRRDVLDAIDVDVEIVRAVMSYVPNFFPPDLAVEWALGAMARCPGVKQDAVLELAAFHGVMYHPREIHRMVRRLHHSAARHSWDPVTREFLRFLTVSTEKYDVVPSGTIHGTQIKFQDSPMTSVCLVIEKLKTARVTSWLRVMFDPEGTLDLSFRPRKIDELSAACRAVQLRMLCVDDRSNVTKVAECWYKFEVHEDGTYRLIHGHPYGDVSGVTRMLAEKSRQLRLDFFYGPYDVFDNPFDANSCTKSLLAILSGPMT